MFQNRSKEVFDMTEFLINQGVTMAVREGFERITLTSLSCSGRTNTKASSFALGHKRTIKASFSFQKCSKICFGLISSASRSINFETRGFEPIASFHDTNKNNHLATSQKIKTTSNNVKTPVSAYSLHTLISKRALL